MFQEAAKLIEKADVSKLMRRDRLESSSQMSSISQPSCDIKSPSTKRAADNLPLLVMLSLIKDEDSALSLSHLLLEKGYNMSMCDVNGLCALNYVIALKRFKLLSLFLNSFNFELNSFHDCYRNTFLHYAFATNNKQVIKQFRDTYSKYYEWNVEKFKQISNCDGLSLKDLNDYFEFMSDRSTYMKHIRNVRSSTASLVSSQFLDEEFHMNSYKMPECFKFNSNPIIICNYINKVFNISNSTIKSELVFLTNERSLSTLQPNFKVNMLYQIKSLNRPIRPRTLARQHKMIVTTSSSHSNQPSTAIIQERNMTLNTKFTRSRQFSPINTSEHMPKMLDLNSHNRLITDEIEIKPIFKSGTGSSCIGVTQNGVSLSWRSDFKRVFSDFSTISSPSYRVSTAVIQKALVTAPGKDAGGGSKNNSERGAGCGGGSVGRDGGGDKDGPSTSAKESKASKMNNAFVIKQATTNINATGTIRRESIDKLKASGHPAGAAQQTKYDIYLVPSSLVNGGSSRKSNK